MAEYKGLFPTREGAAQGGAAERVMLDNVGGAEGIRTKIQTNPDGSETRLRTRAGMPEFVTTLAKTTADEPAKYRGFCFQSFWWLASAIISSKAWVIWYVAGWVAKIKTTIITPKNYSVEPRRTTGALLPDEEQAYFDVFALFDSKLYLNGKPYRESPVAQGNPHILTAAAYPKSASDDASDYHVFVTNVDGVQHFSGRGLVVDGQHMIVDNINDLPLIANPLSNTYRYNLVDARYVAWGQAVVMAGLTAQIVNRFFWYSDCALVTHAPYVSPTNYKGYLPGDLFIDMSDSPSVGYNNGPATDIPNQCLRAGNVAFGYIFTATGNTADTNSDGTIDNWEYLSVWVGPLFGEMRPDPQGTNGTHTATYTYSNSKHNELSIALSPELTWKMEATVSVSWEKLDTVWWAHLWAPPNPGNFSLVGQIQGIYPADGWVGRFVGNGNNIRRTNNASSKTKITVGDITLYEFSCAQYFSKFAGVSYASTVTDLHAPAQDLPIQTPNPWWGTANSIADGVVHWVPYGFTSSWENDNDVWATTPFDYTDHSKSATTTTRDYLYHDTLNGVALYVKLVGTYSDGGSSQVMTVEFESPFGNASIPITTSSSTGSHSAAEVRIPYYTNEDYPPTYVAPVLNIGVHTPMTEQGDFAHIAYTTAQEHGADIEKRLILDLPLFLWKARPMLSEPPTVPDYAYGYCPLNCSDAASKGGGNPFTEAEQNVYHIRITHDGMRDWLVDVQVKAALPTNATRYATCWRI